jgi:chemotaxis protein MotB
MSSGHGKRKKPEEEHEEEGGSERWLVTYADMLTLLMVLFIVLFASSNIDKKKYAGLQKSLSSALNDGSPGTAGGQGILDGGTTVNDQKGSLAGNPIGPDQSAAQVSVGSLGQSVDSTLGKISEKVSAALKAKNLTTSVAQARTGGGLIITIVTDKVLFNSGSDVLLPEGVKILDALAPALVNTGRNITVTGHTDSVPITGGEFPDNLWLSSARAITVEEHLIHDGVDAPTGVGLSATGYGDTQPVADNTTAAGRGKNRRVEIIVAPAPSGSGTATPSIPAVPGTSTAPLGASSAPQPASAVTTAKATVRPAGGAAMAGTIPAGIASEPAPTAAVTAFPPLTDRTTAPAPGGHR